MSCNTCGTKAQFKCGQCKTTDYCSPECQKKDWKQHKQECVPNETIVEMFWKFVEKAKQDNGITEDEYKQMRYTVNRLAGTMNSNSDEFLTNHPFGTKGGGDSKTNMNIAVLYILDRRLMMEGRGVRLRQPKRKNLYYKNKIAYILKPIGGLSGPQRKYLVQIEKSEKKITVRPDEVTLISLNDPRHWKHAIEFDQDPEDVFPQTADAYKCHRLRQHTPIFNSYKWEYYDAKTEKWIKYSDPVSYEIEVMFGMGSPHFLYRPGAPHCFGQAEFTGSISQVLAKEIFAGDPWHLNPHDFASRQIVFRELEGVKPRPLMTERDLYTGMRRPVRRLGPPHKIDPRFYVGQSGDLGEAYHFMDKSVGNHCDLCHTTRGKFVKMECCGGWVCDHEDEYEIGSYEREGQCARNHRYGSICYHHFEEGHKGSWKDCQDCVESFSPFDYVVKASSMADSRTIRRYNFDHNVRHDLDILSVDFPTCAECKEPVDTTEENTRTLTFRRVMGIPCLCKYHGGGFGWISMPEDY